jgi:hypothetical protein
VIAVLGEQRLQQPQAVEAVLGQHAPRAEVAEPLATPFDHPLRVEREIDADDGLVV